LALTSPTGGGRSVGIVRSRTKATEFSLVTEDSGRLGFDHVSLGEWFVTFDHVALMFKNEAWSFEISETTHPMIHCHNPEDLNLQPCTCYRCKNSGMLHAWHHVSWCVRCIMVYEGKINFFFQR